MGRLGVLKPLRGTEASLANVVLEDGEIAFAYPSTGPGTGTGGIKMGNGTSTFSALDWYINGEGSGPSPSWHYNEGTDEAALLNNINHPEYETIGKIYYIQAYYHNSSQYTQGTPVISTGMPYMVIGVNHDGTSTTVDLMSLVPANYIVWNSSYNSWTYGKYSTSNVYSWLSNTCPNGYSEDIQTKMVEMTERWREATGNTTGEMQSRTTKCKLLNPVEMFGYSSATYDPGWEYGSSSDHKTDFASPTGNKYGSLYEVWTDDISSLSNRCIFHNKSMSTTSYSWNNSWLALNSQYNSARCFFVGPDGWCGNNHLGAACGVAPVIRLQGTSGPEPSVTGWQGWVNAGGLDYTDYESLDEVLANEKTVRQLMTKHSSVDYLVQHSAASFVSTVINNDYCAKWINLRDYALDTLYADSTIADLIDQADKYFYGELALMPQVPKMTSNTAPYGEAFASTENQTSQAAWMAFDNDELSLWVAKYNNTNNYIGYKFTNSVNISKIKILVCANVGSNITQPSRTFTIQASNDDFISDIRDVGTFTIDSHSPQAESEYKINIDKDISCSCSAIRCFCPDIIHVADQWSVNFRSMQFYALQPKGNVPIMTSNTAPYGTASASSVANNDDNIYGAFKAFDNDAVTRFLPAINSTVSDYWLKYTFTNPIKVMEFAIQAMSGAAANIQTAYFDVVIKGSNDGTNWDKLSNSVRVVYSSTFPDVPIVKTKINNPDFYIHYGLFIEDSNMQYAHSQSNGGYGLQIMMLQFYGRELKVSVPTMTSNTAPWGEAFASSCGQAVPTYPYYAFNNYPPGPYGGLSRNGYIPIINSTSWYFGYKFANRVCLKLFTVTTFVDGHVNNYLATIQGSNDGSSWTDLSSFTISGTTNNIYIVNVINSNSYLQYRVFSNSEIHKPNNGTYLGLVQFYGLDYSEYEFDPDYPRHYIYDHGVSVETVTLEGSATREDNCIKLKAVNDQAYKALSIADYNLLRGTVGPNASGTNALMCGSSTASFSATNMPYNNSLDVSSISTANNTGVKQTAAGTFDIEEIWLE